MRCRGCRPPPQGSSPLLTVPPALPCEPPASPRWGPLLRGGPWCSHPAGTPPHPPPAPPRRGVTLPVPSPPPLRGRPAPCAAGQARAGPNKELFNFLFYLTPAVCCFLPPPGGGAGGGWCAVHLPHRALPAGAGSGGRGDALLSDSARHFRRAGFTSGAVRRLRGDGAMEAAAERKVGLGAAWPVPAALGGQTGPGGAGTVPGPPHLATPHRGSGRRRRRRPTCPGRKMRTTCPTCPSSSASSRW